MSDHFSQTNAKGVTYHLNSQQVTLRGGHERVIYFFSKDVRPTACALPSGYLVTENPRNGFLTLKKVR